MYDENKSCRDLLDLNFEMFKQGEDISVPSYSEPIRKNVSKRERRRSKDITSHVRAIDSKSGWTSAKGLMANATLFRYKTETFVENNSELYNSLMFMADAYNTAALSKDIAIALGSAAMGNPAVPINKKIIIERFLRNELALNTFYLNSKNSKFLA